MFKKSAKPDRRLINRPPRVINQPPRVSRVKILYALEHFRSHKNYILL